jgi:hypothetical protein
MTVRAKLLLKDPDVATKPGQIRNGVPQVVVRPLAAHTVAAVVVAVTVAVAVAESVVVAVEVVGATGAAGAVATGAA